MSFFWGNDLLDESAGLDILGVRGIDQNVEISLVNGITTISQRARYFLLLPWALGEFFKIETAGGDASFDWESLMRFIRRVEFVIMSATRIDQTIDDGTGLLGPDVYRDELAMLLNGEATDFPTEKGGAMLGTYFRPCAALGLLADGAPGSGVPIRLTPRGTSVWEIKQHALEGAAVIRAIHQGTQLHRSVIEPVVSEFSVGALKDNRAEANALREALFVSWKTGNKAEDEIISGAYQRFTNTRQWLARTINGNPSWPPNILTTNYRACATSHDSDDTGLAWAEYEFLRRCHFAQELLLAALTDQLAISGDASVDEIVASWATAVPNSASRFWPAAASAWKGTTGAAEATVSMDLFFAEPLPIIELRNQSPADRALTSFALLCALMKQSHELRRHSKFGEQGRARENPIKILEAAGSEQVTDLMRKLLEACVVGPHLATTLRKMGAGQKCSLRFFPDGPRLRATGIKVSPSQSGDRLTNVVRILADIGIFQRMDNGYVLGNNGLRQ